MGEGDGGLLCAIFWYNFLCLQLFQNKKVIITIIIVEMGFPGGSAGKESPLQCRIELGFNPWDRKFPCRRKMATHSRILAWRIPWTEEPGGLQSKGSQS